VGQPLGLKACIIGADNIKTKRNPAPEELPMSTYTKIADLADLQSRANIDIDEDGCDCFIALAGGLVRSSKHITYSPADGSWHIYHEIDDQGYEYVSCEEMLRHEKNLVEALRVGALWSY
jgi:hypothetical protein